MSNIVSEFLSKLHALLDEYETSLVTNSNGDIFATDLDGGLDYYLGNAVVGEFNEG